MPPHQTHVAPDAGREEFIATHVPVLEQDEVRHNLILASVDRFAQGLAPDLRRWTLGSGGACAVQTPGWPIVLGELDHRECHALADATAGLDYSGVVGPEHTAPWFALRAAALGLRFAEPIPQRIHALRDSPVHPGAPGDARPADAASADLYADWVLAFLREAAPHDRLPDRDALRRVATPGSALFWVVNGEPVSTATVVRRTRHTAAIGRVYTPPHLRGRGYAGSVTAALAERILAEGKAAACLYTDLRNPISNRCYAKIGFRAACVSWHVPRLLADLRGDGAGCDASALAAAGVARTAPGVLERCWRAFRDARRQRGLRTGLHELSDRQLRDIGILRDQIDCCADREIDPRSGRATAFLWVSSRGMS